MVETLPRKCRSRVPNTVCEPLRNRVESSDRLQLVVPEAMTQPPLSIWTSTFPTATYCRWPVPETLSVPVIIALLAGWLIATVGGVVSACALPAVTKYDSTRREERLAVNGIHCVWW